MRKILLFFICMSCIKPNKTENNIYTDTKELEKYINLPVAIQKAEYEISKTKLGELSQDCSQIIEIYAVIKFSNQDYKTIFKSADKKHNFPLIVKKEYCRDWYPPYVKKFFVKDSNELFKINSAIYEENNFLKENTKGNLIFFPVENNTICCIASICEK